MQTIDGETYLDANEVVTLLGVKRATLYAYVSRGVLHSYKRGVGRQRLYRRDEVDALLTLRPGTTADSAEIVVASSLPYADTWSGDH